GGAAEWRGSAVNRAAWRSTVEAIAQICVHPGDVNTNGTLIHAASAAGAQFRKASILQLARARFPGAADTSRVGFAAKGVAAHGLEIGTGIEAGATANAVQRFLQNGIV